MTEDVGVVMTEDVGVVMTEDVGVIMTEDVGVVVMEDVGVVVMEDVGVVMTEDVGVVMTEDVGVVMTEDVGVVVMEDVGVVVTEDVGVVVMEDVGVVVTEDVGVVVMEDVGVVVMEPGRWSVCLGVGGECEMEKCHEAYLTLQKEGVEEGPTQAYCSMLHRYSQCLTKGSCRGNLNYHTTRQWLNNLLERNNCTDILGDGPSVCTTRYTTGTTPPPPQARHPRTYVSTRGVLPPPTVASSATPTSRHLVGST
ncbi:hypothetical protein Pcinc_012455 [Petrolisthes cinctipes]|uniref:Repulsive guidance molecule N-terminal domain-containing protein n=1 Tax=Petrolisthes cinctipes TaxID=88211 RepID=A0AAE1FYU6_PETCI|nr:hypothetical protein Pcinc_012455 [Petrolisthes cinctipes]